MVALFFQTWKNYKSGVIKKYKKRRENGSLHLMDSHDIEIYEEMVVFDPKVSSIQVSEASKFSNSYQNYNHYNGPFKDNKEVNDISATASSQLKYWNRKCCTGFCNNTYFY